TLDLLTKPDQLPAAARLVAANPQTRFVLDHLSKPTMRDADYDAWAAGISAVAANPQVACKLSGFLTFDAGMTTQRLRPYYDHLLASFGAERILFGSDWPVSVLGGGYPRAVEIVEELTADLDDAARDRIWRATALEWYPAAAKRLASRS
ncbi:MAG: amidohydrolase family protein, partial [Propionibacteriaceae bacterium]|nr:amidohydrolase family protein [Propionibacteriaceae bacterium]